MSQPCATHACDRTACALCHCCQQNICVVHLNEHNNYLNSRLNPFVDTIQSLDAHLKSIDIATVSDTYRQQLEHWRADSHRKIDQYVEQKYQEVERLLKDKVNEERNEINHVHNKVNKLIHDQQMNRTDIYELSTMVDYLERQVKNLHENFIDIQIRPLAVDANSIYIRGINEEVYNLSILSPTYRTIHQPEGSYRILASNDRILLMHQTPNLCFVNEDLLIYKQVPWRNEKIFDVCWSTTLKCFVLTTAKNVFLLSESDMSTEKIKALEKRKWLSCTCSEKCLFLSTNESHSSIMKVSLASTKKFDQQWQSNICKSDEIIDTLRYEKENLAVIIKNHSENTTRMDLRSAETLRPIWSFILDITWSPTRPLHCCPFIGEDWLISDFESGRLLHITKTGNVNSTISYNTIPYRSTLFGTHVLAVSTEDGVNFHKLNYKKTYTIFVL
ncbi:unnamed protein product [Adineta ricciae]|uniref:Uncharacterized protein n=1 Tax=Adineta ricciae TaxID=249248 RepID=A0A814GZX5_ADIRI|nr:unnamed protein product [Adineta ricciae]CAF1003443.1 unnamed protein product [Adineta ricciae]